MFVGHPSMLRLVFISVALLLCSAGLRAESVYIDHPYVRAMIQQVDGKADIPVDVYSQGLPAEGGVQIVLDIDTAAERSVSVFTGGSTSYTFPSVPVGEHSIDVFSIDGQGNQLGAHDQHTQIGVGDIIVAVGDSITAGEDDDIYTDDRSSDGRVVPWVDMSSGMQYGGFEPILSDKLTEDRGYPVMVVNKGWPGDVSAQGLARIADCIAQYPTAATWLIAFGTNDSNHSVPASQYAANIQGMITQIQSSIPYARIYIPKVFYWTKANVQEYHRAIGDIVRSTPSTYWGADLETLFASNHAQYNHLTGQNGTWFSPEGTHHPNGIGIQMMAWLWELALENRITLVSDGYNGTVGGIAADGIEIRDLQNLKLSQRKLLMVKSLLSPNPPAPPGVAFAPVNDPFQVILSTGDEYFGGTTIGVGILATPGMRSSIGASSWNQIFVAKDGTQMSTSRKVDVYNGSNYDLWVTLRSPGQVAIVADVFPPVTTCTPSPAAPGSDGWYTTAPKLTLSAVDGTGVTAKYLRYRWDTGSETTYTFGSALTITVPVGEHTLYYYSVDSLGNTEPTRSVTIKVRSGPAAPKCVSVSPSSGTVAIGTPVPLASLYSDANGFADIQLAYLTVKSKDVVYLKYDQGDNLLYLRNDTNTDWLGGAAPGSGTVLENRYCKLYCDGTMVTGSGNQFTVSWKLEFKTAMPRGTLPVSMRVVDNGGLYDDWKVMANLTF